MHKTLVAGAGTIGTLIAFLLAYSGDYEVFLIDNNISHLDLFEHEHFHVNPLDVTDASYLKKYIKENEITIVISSLPYFYNVAVAAIAADLNINYFDLTEDINVTMQLKHLAAGRQGIFMPQCGVAPGFINIVANHLMLQFDKIKDTHLRAGCLPKHSHNSLQYAITWSLDGLINEYGNLCYGLIDGQKMPLQPLDDLEVVELDGILYEAFNTSGGIGSLIDTYQGKVETLNYKTLRYPGHCEKMRFLMKDLQLNEDRPTLKKILENSLPRTDQDVMLIYVSVTGEKSGNYFEQSYVKKIEPQVFYGRKWSAIQVSTASSLCVVVDIVMNNLSKYHGFISQEQISLENFLSNQFAKGYNL